MRISFDVLEQVDRLTSKEIPTLDDDEWVEIRRYRDYTRDASAETKSLVRVSEEETLSEPRDDDEDGEQDAPQAGGFRVDQGKYLMAQFEYMCLRWNLFAPKVKGVRSAIPFTRENREKFVRLNGAFILGQMLIRGGGIAPDLKGEVDPDTGKPLEFQDDDPLPARRRMGKAAMGAQDSAPSVRTA